MFWSATSASQARILTLGASIINCTEFNMADATLLTFNEGTSSIRVTGTGAFTGGGLTYYDVQLNGTAHTISGSNTFTTLTLKADTTQTITFTDGTTQTITTPTLTGSVGKVKTLKGSGVAGWSIAKAGGGSVLTDYLSLSYSIGSPASTWYAGPHSTDVVGNSGWLFGILPPDPFTLTDLGAITINANWTPGAFAGYTMIRASRVAYPDSITSGELIYYGDNTSANFSGYALDLSTYYVSAWSFESDNITHSDIYTMASIGGESMADMVTQWEILNSLLSTMSTDILSLLSTMSTNLFAFVLPIFLMIIAVWRRTWLLYVLAGFAWVLYGFGYWTTNHYMSIILVLVGIFCFAGAKWDRS